MSNDWRKQFDEEFGSEDGHNRENAGKLFVMKDQDFTPYSVDELKSFIAQEKQASREEAFGEVREWAEKRDVSEENKLEADIFGERPNTFGNGYQAFRDNPLAKLKEIQ